MNKYNRKKCKKCEYEDICIDSMQFHADEYCNEIKIKLNFGKKKKNKLCDNQQGTL
jgi:hypothetical protein